MPEAIAWSCPKPMRDHALLCIYGYFCREITKYTVHIYGSGQPYLNICACLSNLAREPLFDSSSYVHICTLRRSSPSTHGQHARAAGSVSIDPTLSISGWERAHNCIHTHAHTYMQWGLTWWECNLQHAYLDDLDVSCIWTFALMGFV